MEWIRVAFDAEKSVWQCWINETFVLVVSGPPFGWAAYSVFDFSRYFLAGGEGYTDCLEAIKTAESWYMEQNNALVS